MALWLKSEKHADGTNVYSVPQINNIPTVVGAINFVFMVGSGTASDLIGSRAPVMAFVGACQRPANVRKSPHWCIHPLSFSSTRSFEDQDSSPLRSRT